VFPGPDPATDPGSVPASRSAPLSSSPVLLSSGLHRTMPSQIADWIAAEIVAERFAPGQRLNEKELAERLGVSRAPLREALRMLETRGMVTIAPQRGARVTLLSREEMVQLFEIRAVLVGLAAREVARRWDARLEHAIAPCLAALERALDDPPAYAQASSAAALEIARASGNPRLAEMIGSFALQIGRYTRLGLSTRTRRDRSIGNWRALFDAFRANDENVAESLQRLLATENRDAALRIVAERDGVAPPVLRAASRPA
jgi:DNA-binding GntR family transcriptional regulator